MALLNSRWFASIFLLSIACGGDDSATTALPIDASLGAEAKPDVSFVDDTFIDVFQFPEIDGGAMCNPGLAFGAPVLVTEIDTSGSEASLRLSQDSLTGYFASARDGGVGGIDLWSASRTLVSDPFGAPQNLVDINSPTQDTHPSVTADGLTIVFESDRALPNQAIFAAMRSNTQTPFSFPFSVTNLELPGVVADPFIRADGQVLYFTSGATEDLDLYRAYRVAGPSVSFGAAQSVGELNGQGIEELPTVTPNDRVMYFSSNRVDASSRGGFEIWLAVRPSLNDPYSAPALVPELNSNDDDFPDFISPDGCTIYFHRSVAMPDGGQTKSIYRASKSMQ